MNFSLVLCWSVIRAIIVCSLATGLFVPLRNTLRQQKGSHDFTRWLPALAVVPLFMPDLLLGFTYRLVSAKFDFSAVTTETFYAALLLTKVIAIQMICHWLVPPSEVSPSAIHLWKLTAQNSLRSRLALVRMMLSGPYRSITVGWILGALGCFQDFEIAALLQIEQHPIAWTVWLFDAKAANEPLLSCVFFALPAIVIQGAFIAACVVALQANQAKPQEQSDAIVNGGWASNTSWFHVSTCVIGVGFLLTIAWPITLHGISGIKGLWKLTATGTLQLGMEQIFKSVLVAILSAIASWRLARWLFTTKSIRLTLIAIIPGLLSPLALCLLLLLLFLTPLFRPIYDSWIPLIVAQTLWLLPRAFLFNVAVERTFRSEQIHTAALLNHSRNRHTQKKAKQLRWLLEQRPAWFSVTVLTVMAFWEVTINSILHPVSLEPMVCRLYREMHFGHTEVLAVLTALSIALPLLILAIGAQMWKLVRK